MIRGYLLDTNVVSEIRKSYPNASVLVFLNTQTSTNLFASVLTLGEMRKGIAKKRSANTAAAHELGAWIDEWERSYGDRVLPVDDMVARIWGHLPPHPDASRDRFYTSRHRPSSWTYPGHPQHHRHCRSWRDITQSMAWVV